MSDVSFLLATLMSAANGCSPSLWGAVPDGICSFPVGALAIVEDVVRYVKERTMLEQGYDVATTERARARGECEVRCRSAARTGCESSRRKSRCVVLICARSRGDVSGKMRARKKAIVPGQVRLTILVVLNHALIVPMGFYSDLRLLGKVELLKRWLWLMMEVEMAMTVSELGNVVGPSAEKGRRD